MIHHAPAARDERSDAGFEPGQYGSGSAEFVTGGALPVKLRILLDELLHLLAGQKYGGMILIAHHSADL